MKGRKSHVPSSGNLKTDLLHLKQRLSTKQIVNALEVFINMFISKWLFFEHMHIRTPCTHSHRLCEQRLEGIEDRLRNVRRYTPTDTDLLTFQFDRGRNEAGLSILKTNLYEECVFVVVVVVYMNIVVHSL